MNINLPNILHQCIYISPSFRVVNRGFYSTGIALLLLHMGSYKGMHGRLDAFHRRQLRSLLGIRYPARVSNAALYKKCHSSPISETISRRRLTMLGYTLRLTEDTPTQQAMRLYFHPPSTARSSTNNVGDRTSARLPYKTQTT